MRRTAFVCVLAALAAGLLAVSCSDGDSGDALDSYDPLIEEYNENFKVVYDDAAQYSVDDDEFDASWMLKDLYEVSNRALTSFSIVGPQDGTSYSWSVRRSDTGDLVSLSGVDLEGRTFTVYLPTTTQLKVQTMYSITLSVTNKAGRVFTDTGKLWIENE